MLILLHKKLIFSLNPFLNCIMKFEVGEELLREGEGVQGTLATVQHSSKLFVIFAIKSAALVNFSLQRCRII